MLVVLRRYSNVLGSRHCARVSLINFSRLIRAPICSSSKIACSLRVLFCLSQPKQFVHAGRLLASPGSHSLPPTLSTEHLAGISQSRYRSYGPGPFSRSRITVWIPTSSFISLLLHPHTRFTAQICLNSFNFAQLLTLQFDQSDTSCPRSTKPRRGHGHVRY
jgi:hypothetical protein